MRPPSAWCPHRFGSRSLYRRSAVEEENGRATGAGFLTVPWVRNLVRNETRQGDGDDRSGAPVCLSAPRLAYKIVVDLKELDLRRIGHANLWQDRQDSRLQERIERFARFPHVNHAKAVVDRGYPVEELAPRRRSAWQEAQPLQGLVLLLECRTWEVKLHPDRHASLPAVNAASNHCQCRFHAWVGFMTDPSGESQPKRKCAKSTGSASAFRRNRVSLRPAPRWRATRASSKCRP